MESLRACQETQFSGTTLLSPAYNSGGDRRTGGGFPVGGGFCSAYSGGAYSGFGGAPGHSYDDRARPHAQCGLGGVEECHREHVKQLLLDVAALKAKTGPAGDDPWARSRRPAENRETAREAQLDQNGGQAREASTPSLQGTLPLIMQGFLWAITLKDQRRVQIQRRQRRSSMQE